jgi:hypothetical protein
MDATGLTLLGMTLIGGIGTLLWQRHRKQRLPTTHHSVRCPLHDGQAEVAVRTDLGAQSCRQFVGVTTCSLLSDAAVALPERTAYLSDFPPHKVRLEAARSHPVYAAEVSCPQHCVLVLNQAAVSVAPRPVECTSGAAMELATQTVGNPRIIRLLWYFGS